MHETFELSNRFPQATLSAEQAGSKDANYSGSSVQQLHALV